MGFRGCLAVLLLLAMGSCWADVSLRVGASSSWTLPYARYDNNELVDGIIFDVTQSLGQALALPVTYVVLPRKRLEGASRAGHLDLRCNLTPQWTPTPEDYVWTDPLFDMSDVVFGRVGAPQLQDLSRPQGSVVLSTVLGYAYPTLEAYFQGGQLKRDDTVEQEKVMSKVDAGRTPYGVSDALALSWYKRTTPGNRLAKWKIVVSNHSFQCAIPTAGRVSATQINAALQAMKKAGRFEQILRAYR